MALEFSDQSSKGVKSLRNSSLNGPYRHRRRRRCTLQQRSSVDHSALQTAGLGASMQNGFSPARALTQAIMLVMLVPAASSLLL